MTNVRSLRPRRLGQLVLSDGLGVAYTFEVHALRSQPVAFDAVFAFVRLEGAQPVPLFICCAEDLSIRLGACPEREAARDLGASYLLVHVPEEGDDVSATAAAGRLRSWYCPALNGRQGPNALGTAPTLQQVAGTD